MGQLLLESSQLPENWRLLPVSRCSIIIWWSMLWRVFPFGSERFVKLREQFWLAMFHEAAEAGRSLIFTFAPEASVAPDFSDRAGQAVEAAGGEIIFVRLTLSHDEQERRIGNHDRVAFGKLRSVDPLRELRHQFTASEAAMPPVPSPSIPEPSNQLLRAASLQIGSI